jgi:hypothetical protein
VADLDLIQRIIRSRITKNPETGDEARKRQLLGVLSRPSGNILAPPEELPAEPTLPLLRRFQPPVDPGMAAGGETQAGFDQGKQLLRRFQPSPDPSLAESDSPRLPLLTRNPLRDSLRTMSLDQPPPTLNRNSSVDGKAAQVENALPAIFRRRVDAGNATAPPPDSSAMENILAPLDRKSTGMSPGMAPTADAEGKARWWDSVKPGLLERIVAPDQPPSDPGTAIRPRRVSVDPMAAEQPIGTRGVSAPPPNPLRRALSEDARATEQPTFNGKPLLAERLGGEPFGTRDRRTQPRDFAADDEQYLRDLENKPPSKKDRFLQAVRFATVVGTGIDPGGFTNTRGNRIARARDQLATDLAVGQSRAQTANAESSAYERLSKPPTGLTRIVDEGEYSGVPAGSEIRQEWNGREYVDMIGRDNKPVVSKAPPAEKAAAREIKYDRQGHALLVNKDGSGRSSPIFEPDGVTPLTKERNESGNVQTAYRLADDGITQIQVERDGETGQWVDSVGRDNRPLVRGKVGKIDPNTGAPISTVITNNRVAGQQRQENQRKRQSYEGEAKEWGGKETSYRQNKTAEDDAIKTKTAQLRVLYNEKPSAYGGLIGGTRTQQEIDIEKARLQKEIATHRTNAAHFQSEADKAASAATQARRNAGLYADTGNGSQGVIGRAPASDGKHHYTPAEIRAQAETSGVTYESLYQKLKGNKRVVIDQ